MIDFSFETGHECWVQGTDYGCVGIETSTGWQEAWDNGADGIGVLLVPPIVAAGRSNFIFGYPGFPKN
jgi:hypothetical protein